MDEVLKFLTENPTFYFSTVDGDTPKVRPFGFVMNYNGKLCFCTNNQKDVFKQLKTNPKFEISTANETGEEWLRLSGKAVFITSLESKKAALDSEPNLRNLYSEDDGIFEIFYADEAVATFYTMSGTTRTIKL
jgi:uncharacterized pyridoxamine 5'-phosphate oxidase family protein